MGDSDFQFHEINCMADIIGEPPEPGMLERGRKRAADMDLKNWIDPLFEVWRQAGVAVRKPNNLPRCTQA